MMRSACCDGPPTAGTVGPRPPSQDLTAADRPEEVDEYLRSASLNLMHLACHGAAADLLDADRPDAAWRVLRGAVRNDVNTLWFNACRGAPEPEQELFDLFRASGHRTGPDARLQWLLLVVPTTGVADRLDETAADATWDGKWVQIKSMPHQHKMLARWLAHPAAGAVSERSASRDSDRFTALERRLAKLEAEAARERAGSGPVGKAGNDPPR
jgi:hypothetical protein